MEDPVNKDCAILIAALAVIFMLGYLARSEWSPAVEKSAQTKVHVQARKHIVEKGAKPSRAARKHPTLRHKYQAKPATQPRVSHAVYSTYPPRHSYTQDLAECKMLAQQAAGYVPEEAVKGGLLGGAIGAAAGAAIGAVLGHAGKGAAIGAAAGGIGGGAYRGLSSDQKYKQVYSACMRNRGWNVLN